MAIYHFSAKVISRSSGASVVAAAAYRSAERLHDQRIDRHHDFSNKAGVVHSEVMLPEGAPEHLADREQLWNAVEAAEKRVDAQLAREVEFAIPRELGQADGIELARDFVREQFVERGMIADLNVHWDMGADGLAKPHAHVMLTMREVSSEGFGAKVRDWNRTDLLEQWRGAWAEHVNERLAELGIEARIDHRSLKEQGIDLEPQHKIGPAAARMAEQGLASERLAEHRAIARENGERIIATPSLALDAITRTQATFTNRDLAMFVHRHSDDKEQFDRAMSTVRNAPEFIALGKDGRGEDRFTSREMVETEQRLSRATEKLYDRNQHRVSELARTAALNGARAAGLELSAEQRSAFDHITLGRDLGTVVGYAGTGKSAMLGVAREAWERSGYVPVGAALSGIAAENLEHGSGITSSTLASLEHRWAQGRDELTSRSVLVIDEAGMVGTRQMERVIGEAERRGAKVVLVGDTEQLQSIEAGAAFRSVAERHGSVEITDIRRQHHDWQRDATRQLATGRTGEALRSYEERRSVYVAETRDQARERLIERWDRNRQERPGDTRIILTHTNDEVRGLNLAARERLRASGELGKEVGVRTERGMREFATGDRVMFLRNERSLGVKNGSLGRIESVSPVRMGVVLDDGRAVAFDVKDYSQVDHGYAATIHKAQGVTVDHTHVLATPGLDRHAAYVAMSRHRDGLELHYGRDDFADRDKLVRTLSRDRAKDMASDYPRDLNDRSAIVIPETTVKTREPTLAPPSAPKRGMFDGLKLGAGQARVPVRDHPASLAPAVERYARAAVEVMATRRQGLEPLAHQQVALERAATALDAIRPDAARDLRNALARDAGLVDQAAQGKVADAVRGMNHEAQVRTDPALRADRFVEDWQKLGDRRQALDRAGDKVGLGRVNNQLTTMARSLERDPQVESLLHRRLPELGMKASRASSLSHELLNSLSPSRDLGLGL